MTGQDERELLAAEIADAMGWEEFTGPDVTAPNDDAYRLADRLIAARFHLAPTTRTVDELEALRADTYRAAVEREFEAWMTPLSTDDGDGPADDEVALWREGLNAGARATIVSLSAAGTPPIKAVLEQHEPELTAQGEFLGTCACGAKVVGFNDHLALILTTALAPATEVMGDE